MHILSEKITQGCLSLASQRRFAVLIYTNAHSDILSSNNSFEVISGLTI